MKPLILGAAIGSCVHIAGLQHFLTLARAEGFETLSLGAAVPPRRLIDEIERLHPDIVALSYRLTPDVARGLLAEIEREVRRRSLEHVRFIFGGTPTTAEAARASGLFERIFTGEAGPGEVTAFLRGEAFKTTCDERADTLMGRIAQKYPYPLVRHHFGLPSLDATIAGAQEIADACILDVLSIGPDQNAQEHFFRPDEMTDAYAGAGGVPLRTPDDLRAIYDASRTGNHPLVRCYSGTRDLLRWAEMLTATIRNAWAAIPLCWYSVLDGRSNLPLRNAIREKQDAMRWHAQRGIPVEVNEAHQWSLRDAHDALAVAAAFLAAHNAKRAGVRRYVAQLMLNTPPGTTPANDLAKMLAKLALIGRLEDSSFEVFREVRPGIAHFSPDPAIAKGQGAASIALGMTLHPHIIHAVSYSEGDHATTAAELIESCLIAHGAIRNVLDGSLDPARDPRVASRRDDLIRDADRILDAVRSCDSTTDDPWSDPDAIASAIECGILDTPHFQGNPLFASRIVTRCIDGAWDPVDPVTGMAVSEADRLEAITSVPREGSGHRGARHAPAT